MTHSIAGEQTFPIYSVEARWSQAAGEDRQHRVGVQEGLPRGRCWNRTQWYTMFREERPQLAEEVQTRWWPEYSQRFRSPGDFSVEVKPLPREVWCPGLFSHWTFDVGLTDAEVLESFGRYVSRVLCSNLTHGEKAARLMGADERRRWQAISGSPPPCRCENCQAHGVVRINH